MVAKIVHEISSFYCFANLGPEPAVASDGTNDTDVNDVISDNGGHVREDVDVDTDLEIVGTGAPAGGDQERDGGLDINQNSDHGVDDLIASEDDVSGGHRE